MKPLLMNMYSTCIVIASVLWLMMNQGVASPTAVPTVAGKTETEPGQHAESFATKIRAKNGTRYVVNTVELRYLLYLPEEYSKPQQKWPLLLFLHGVGERGTDVEMVAKNGPPKLVKAGKQFPFVIVSPQCPPQDGWSSPVQTAALNALLDDVMARYRVDKDRIYITGLSMGGFGTWRLALEYPTKFAAIAPVCGGGDPTKARLLKNLPVWVFHGAKDPTVPISNSSDMVNALKKCGNEAKFTVYPEAKHDAWTETYNNPELYEWFLQHKRILKK